jgi:putative transport protein
VHAALSFLGHQPLVFLFLLFALGSALGAIRIRDVQIGPAAVLFTAIGLSALAASQGVNLALPEVVGTLGLVLFTYTVGISSGPTFFAALTRGWRPVLTLTMVLVAAAVLVGMVGRALGLTPGTIAGTFAGALTNTPALAAAAERSGDPAGSTVGYSIAYVFGVFGMLVAATVVLRSRGTRDGAAPPLTNATIRVERADSPTVRDVLDRHDGDIAISRVEHAGVGAVHVAVGDEVLGRGDLVTVVGADPVVDEVARELGHRSSRTLNTNGMLLDSRRITLSTKALAGRPLADLELGEQFGATVSRVRRGDVDMVASDDIVTQLGDRLRVICPADRIRSGWPLVWPWACCSARSGCRCPAVASRSVPLPGRCWSGWCSAGSDGSDRWSPGCLGPLRRRCQRSACSLSWPSPDPGPVARSRRRSPPGPAGGWP